MFFVGTEPHGQSLMTNREHLFRVQPLLGVGSACAEMLARNTVIALYLLFGPSLRYKTQNELYGQPRTANNRFTDENGRIGGYMFLPVHWTAFYRADARLSAVKVSGD